jgi:hypothetical protein
MSTRGDKAKNAAMGRARHLAKLKAATAVSKSRLDALVASSRADAEEANTVRIEDDLGPIADMEELQVVENGMVEPFEKQKPKGRPKAPKVEKPIVDNEPDGWASW